MLKNPVALGPAATAFAVAMTLVALGAGECSRGTTPEAYPYPTAAPVAPYPWGTPAPRTVTPWPAPTHTASPTPTATWALPNGPIPVGVTEDEARGVVKDRMQGLSDVRIGWIQLVTARQLYALSDMPYFGGDYQWDCGWAATQDDTPVYVVQATGLEDPNLYNPDDPGPRPVDVVTLVDGLTGRYLAQEDTSSSNLKANALRSIPTPRARWVKRQAWRPPATPTAAPPEEAAGPTYTPRATATSTPTPTRLPSDTASVTDMLRYLPLAEGASWEYVHESYWPNEGWRRHTVRQTVASVSILSPDRRLYGIETKGPPGVLPRWLLLERGRVYVESDQSAADLLKNPDASRAGAPLFAVYPRSAFDFGQPAPDNAVFQVGQSPHRALEGEYAACVPELWIQSARFFTENWMCPGRGIVDQITGVDVCGYVERYRLTRFSSGSTPTRTGDGD